MGRTDRARDLGDRNRQRRGHPLGHVVDTDGVGRELAKHVLPAGEVMDEQARPPAKEMDGVHTGHLAVAAAHQRGHCPLRVGLPREQFDHVGQVAQAGRPDQLVGVTVSETVGFGREEHLPHLFDGVPDGKTLQQWLPQVGSLERNSKGKQFASFVADGDSLVVHLPKSG